MLLLKIEKGIEEARENEQLLGHRIELLRHLYDVIRKNVSTNFLQDFEDLQHAMKEDWV